MIRFKPSVERVEGRIVQSNLFYTITDEISHALGTDHAPNNTSSTLPVPNTVAPVKAAPTTTIYLHNQSGEPLVVYTRYFDSTKNSWQLKSGTVANGDTVTAGTEPRGTSFYVGTLAVKGMKGYTHPISFGNTPFNGFLDAPKVTRYLSPFKVASTNTTFTVNLS